VLLLIAWSSTITFHLLQFYLCHLLAISFADLILVTRSCLCKLLIVIESLFEGGNSFIENKAKVPYDLRENDNDDNPAHTRLGHCIHAQIGHGIEKASHCQNAQFIANFLPVCLFREVRLHKVQVA